MNRIGFKSTLGLNECDYMDSSKLVHPVLALGLTIAYHHNPANPSKMLCSFLPFPVRYHYQVILKYNLLRLCNHQEERRSNAIENFL